MGAEDGGGKEREVLILINSSLVQPQYILGVMVEMTCPGLPFFGLHIR